MSQLAEFVFGQVVIWGFLYSGYVLSSGHPVQPYIF
jgi:hypothetical protein